jgi:hypothetical protein
MFPMFFFKALASSISAFNFEVKIIFVSVFKISEYLYRIACKASCREDHLVGTSFF